MSQEESFSLKRAEQNRAKLWGNETQGSLGGKKENFGIWGSHEGNEILEMIPDTWLGDTGSGVSAGCRKKTPKGKSEDDQNDFCFKDFLSWPNIHQRLHGGISNWFCVSLPFYILYIMSVLLFKRKSIIRRLVSLGKPAWVPTVIYHIYIHVKFICEPFHCNASLPGTIIPIMLPKAWDLLQERDGKWQSVNRFGRC